MSKRRKHTNPFDVLLTIVGVLFVVTASAYGVMTVLQIEPREADEQPHPLMSFMDDHGFTLLMAELVVLAIATFAAIGTDAYWTGETDNQSATPANVPDTERTS